MPPAIKLSPDGAITMDLGANDVSVGGPAHINKPRVKTGPAPSPPAKKKIPVPAPMGKRKTRRFHVRADLAEGGSLHIRHHMMNDREVTIRGEGLSVTLADDPKKPIWIELAREGTFKGHPSGPFSLNDQVFNEIVRNFNATENKSVPIDFEHASEADATDGTIPVMGAPAQGWIRDMKIANNRLLGLVEWGARAAEYIKSGAYKFFSPAIRFGSKDRVSGQPIGARMTSGALTNIPFLDGLKPLAAKAFIPSGTSIECGDHLVELRALAHSPNEYMPAIRSALRMSDLSSVRDCCDQMDRLRDHYDASDGDISQMHEGIDLSQYLMPMRSLVGAQPGATWDDVLDVIQDLLEAAGAPPPSSSTAMGDDDDDGGDSGGGDDDSVDMIDAETRNGLDADQFALPSKRKYPIDTAARVRNAAARLAQQKKAGGISDAEYSEAKGRIARAAKKFGIDSEFNNADNGGDLFAMHDESTLILTETEQMDLAAKVTELSTSLAKAESSVTLSETKLNETSLKLKASEEQTAELSIKLKAETEKLDVATTELVALKAWKEEFETKAFDARLTEAFDTYKDARKLGDNDRKMMAITLKSNPALFEESFPKVSADKRHLQRNLSDHRETTLPVQHTNEGQAPGAPGAGIAVDFATASRALAHQKRIPLRDAQRIVSQQFAAQRAATRR